MDMIKLTKISGLAVAAALLAVAALAQEAAPAADVAEVAVAAAVPTDVAWILNSLLFLIGGFLCSGWRPGSPCWRPVWSVPRT